MGEEKPKPNVILAQDPRIKPIAATVEGDDNSGIINIGMTTIEMPTEGEQRAGWYDPNAHLLKSQFPRIYKNMIQREVENPAEGQQQTPAGQGHDDPENDVEEEEE